jgi:hypothetical protein
MVEQAGWSTTSGVSVLAGTLVAFGAVALIAAGAGAAGNALGLDTNGISTHEWRQAGLVAGAVAALVIFGSFYFGGYAAGRMSARAGARHGVLVFLMSVVLIAVIAGIAWALGTHNDVNVTNALHDNGVPTDANTWSDIGLGTGIAAAVAMLLGALIGGIKGERWHGRLVRAVDAHDEAVRQEELDRTRRDAVDVGDTPVDRTGAIDQRDSDELTVEEERAQETRTTAH